MPHYLALLVAGALQTWWLISSFLTVNNVAISGSVALTYALVVSDRQVWTAEIVHDYGCWNVSLYDRYVDHKLPVLARATADAGESRPLNQRVEKHARKRNWCHNLLIHV